MESMQLIREMHVIMTPVILLQNNISSLCHVMQDTCLLHIMIYVHKSGQLYRLWTIFSSNTRHVFYKITYVRVHVLAFVACSQNSVLEHLNDKTISMHINANAKLPQHCNTSILLHYLSKIKVLKAMKFFCTRKELQKTNNARKMIRPVHFV